jgi:hypothetical protein
LLLFDPPVRVFGCWCGGRAEDSRACHPQIEAIHHECELVNSTPEHANITGAVRSFSTFQWRGYAEIILFPNNSVATFPMENVLLSRMLSSTMRMRARAVIMTTLRIMVRER